MTVLNFIIIGKYKKMIFILNYYYVYMVTFFSIIDRKIDVEMVRIV